MSTLPDPCAAGTPPRGPALAPPAVPDSTARWLRRSPRPEDRRLLGLAQTWLSALPRGVRPLLMPVLFPRLVNKLARCWEDAIETDRYFRAIEFDPRDCRQGFPPLVREELQALHRHALNTRIARGAAWALLLARWWRRPAGPGGP